MIIFVIQYALFIFFSALLACIAYFSWCIFRCHTKHNGIPGPKRRSFFLGNLRELQDLRETLDFSEIMDKWSREYGPLCVAFIIHHAFIICTDKAAVKEILTRSKYLKPDAQFKHLRELYGTRALGHGLFTEIDHGAWSKRRSMYNMAFHRKYLMGLMDQFNDASDRLCKYLMQFADGETEVTMTEEFGRTTLHIISKVGFGLDQDVIENPESRLCQLIPILLDGVLACFKNPFLKYSFLPKDLRYKRKVREAIKELRELGRACITSRFEAMQRGDDVPKDILTHILGASSNLDESAGFGIEDMLDDFMTFYVAGQETTSNLLSFALLFLGKNPNIMTRLKKEVDCVLDGKDSIEYADVAKLEYMTLVLKESLRLRPPVGTVPREMPCDTELCGYKVPKGSVVEVAILAMGRSEESFKNPDVFDPDRFTQEDDNPLFAFLPFSLGPRSCIGRVFAMIEAKVIMANLLRTFEFSLVPGQTLAGSSELALKPKDGCKNFIRQRDC